jgi:hypothetical protein
MAMSDAKPEIDARMEDRTVDLLWNRECNISMIRVLLKPETLKYMRKSTTVYLFTTNTDGFYIISFAFLHLHLRILHKIFRSFALQANKA